MHMAEWRALARTIILKGGTAKSKKSAGNNHLNTFEIVELFKNRLQHKSKLGSWWQERPVDKMAVDEIAVDEPGPYPNKMLCPKAQEGPI